MSSDDIAVAVQGISKTYRLFGHPGDRIKSFLSLGTRTYHREYTALQDVSFEARRGETLGIIGRNGSGKSTLLQLVCGILRPSAGSIRVQGRLSALLELGSGFNPEFTGRENVFFQAALMGLDRDEIAPRFDTIATFADIGDYLDQPVRTYSSGMYLRLAFAVAAHVDSDILVVDEALAVGDPGFRARCYRRIGELREMGCTILFVSHAMEQILRLCSRVILLNQGRLVLSGPASDVVTAFHRLLSTGQTSTDLLQIGQRSPNASAKGIRPPVSASTSFTDAASPQDAYDPGIGLNGGTEYQPNGATISAVRITERTGESVELLQSGGTYVCVYRVHFSREETGVRFAMLIKTAAGTALGGAKSAPPPTGILAGVPPDSVVDVAFEFTCRLNPGSYRLSVAVFGTKAAVEYALHGIVDARTFRVVAAAGQHALAHVDFDCKVTIEPAGGEVPP